MYCLVLLSALLAFVVGVPLNNTNPMRDGRIVGGTLTDITSHPYQVVVLSSGSYSCSGSIISANWVVTTADCLDLSIDVLSVRSGSSSSNSGGTLHSVTKVIVHENFSSTYLDYDVALLQVSPAFIFSDSVQPITLECDPVPARTDVVLTGYGDPSSPNGPLQRVTLTTITDSSCQYFFGSWFSDRKICTGDFNGGKGPCLDFGAPLVASNKLVGIFSVGNACGKPAPPDLYTKVSAVCEWIVINAGL